MGHPGPRPKTSLDCGCTRGSIVFGPVKDPIEDSAKLILQDMLEDCKQKVKEEKLELIPDRAVEILEQAIANIKARGKSYNSNTVNYHDYKLNGIDTCWADQLECMVRLWNGGGEDKAADWAAYTALSAAFFEQGIPQSRFSPIYRHLLPRIEEAIKSA